MSTPSNPAAALQYVFSVNIQPATEPGKAVSSKQVNTVSDSIENAVGKVRVAFLGCEVRNVNKLCAIDIP